MCHKVILRVVKREKNEVKLLAVEQGKSKAEGRVLLTLNVGVSVDSQ